MWVRGAEGRQPAAAPGVAAQGRQDIMHVGAVLSPGTEPRDVKLAQLSLLRQFDVVAEIAVVSLKRSRRSELGKGVLIHFCLQRDHRQEHTTREKEAPNASRQDTF